MNNRGWHPRVRKTKGIPTPKWVEPENSPKWLKAMFSLAQGNVPA